jgi:hypothetical protein
MRKPTYEELRRLAAMYEPAPRKHGYHAVIMATVFLVGASVGLGGAWWMTQGNQTTVAAASSADRGAPAMRSFRVDGDQRRSREKGISPAERPFDGAKHAALPKRTPAPAITPEELPYGGQSSGGSGQEKGTVAAGSGEQAATPATTATAAKVPGRSADEVEAVTAVPPVAMTPPTEQPQSAMAKSSRPLDKTIENGADKPVIKPAEKRAAPAVPPVAARETEKPRAKRVPDSRELDRIKQQAAEELRRKNEAKRAPSEARASSSSQRTAKAPAAPAAQARTKLVYNQLAACENAGNFLLREQCKWQLCSGKWGKNGCPSYSTSHSAAY